LVSTASIPESLPRFRRLVGVEQHRLAVATDTVLNFQDTVGSVFGADDAAEVEEEVLRECDQPEMFACGTRNRTSGCGVQVVEREIHDYVAHLTPPFCSSREEARAAFTFGLFTNGNSFWVTYTKLRWRLFLMKSLFVWRRVRAVSVIDCIICGEIRKTTFSVFRGGVDSVGILGSPAIM
jgi:hypothetical protein